MKTSLGNPSTASEVLFEQYLTQHGYSGWSHEKPIEGKPTTPDYRLPFNNADLVFEVKEFDAPPPSSAEQAAHDGYRPIREKITSAARQFKHYKEFSCSLVLANPKFATVDLDTLETVFGAMLGNFGYRADFGVPVGTDNPLVPVFTTGGKMVDRRRSTPQNSTFSSIIVLSYYPLRHKVRETELGRELTFHEVAGVANGRPVFDSDPIRVAVYENPFRRIPLPEEVFCGPFDERWRKDGDLILPIYFGEELRRIEAHWRSAIGVDGPVDS